MVLGSVLIATPHVKFSYVDAVSLKAGPGGAEIA